jgi:hypothetical protein
VRNDDIPAVAGPFQGHVSGVGHGETWNIRVSFPLTTLTGASAGVSTALRIFWVIPIGIVLGAVSGQTWQASYSGGETVAAGAGGALFLGPLLMIMFRRKYPRWWFDWNLELGRFSSRVVPAGPVTRPAGCRFPSFAAERGCGGMAAWMRN